MRRREPPPLTGLTIQQHLLAMSLLASERPQAIQPLAAKPLTHKEQSHEQYPLAVFRYFKSWSFRR